MQKTWLLIICLISLHSLESSFQPEEYNQSNIGQFNHAIKELCKLNLIGNEKLLDIGSGDGKVSTYIAQKYIPDGQLIGLDNDPQMIAFALSHTTAKNISYIHANITQYTNHDQYDAVVSFWTLHWVKEYEKALANIEQLLKPGGKALICHIIGTEPLEPIVHELFKTEKWSAYNTNNIRLTNSPSLSQIANAIEKTQLIIESLEIKKNGEWEHPETMKQNLLSLPIFSFIPTDQRIKFCDDVLQEFIMKYPLDEQGQIYDWAPVVVMVLKKQP